MRLRGASVRSVIADATEEAYRLPVCRGAAGRMVVLRVDACKARRKQAAQVPKLPAIVLDTEEQ
jgi:hypothetical protein